MALDVISRDPQHAENTNIFFFRRFFRSTIGICFVLSWENSFHWTKAPETSNSCIRETFLSKECNNLGSSIQQVAFLGGFAPQPSQTWGASLPKTSESWGPSPPKLPESWASLPKPPETWEASPPNPPQLFVPPTGDVQRQSFFRFLLPLSNIWGNILARNDLCWAMALPVGTGANGGLVCCCWEWR